MKRPAAVAGHRKKSNRNSHRLRSVVLPSTYISHDLVAEILKRLPAKTLCRFLSVCMSWKTLISSTLFAGTHYFTRCAAIPPTMKPYLRDHKPLVSLYSPDHAFAVNLGSVFHLVDVIHGVICFSHYSYDHIILCIPSIHKYVTLSGPTYPLSFDCPSRLIGFGYNSSDNNFKVVKVRFGEAPTYEVYSSRVGKWKKSTSDVLESCFILDPYSEGRKGCFVDETIYWTVSTTNNIAQEYWLLMFDCDTEEFTTEELPQGIVPRKIKLMQYAGMLCLVTELHSPRIFDTVELWVMKEYDWEKLYRFRDICSYDIYDDSLVKLAPFGPKEWIRWGPSTNLFSAYDGVLSGHVCEESMYLMDDATAKSYSKNENLWYSTFEIIY